MGITEKQFLDAVDVIKQYHVQMELKIKQIEHCNKTTIEQFWINYNAGIYEFDMSARLRNAISGVVNYPEYNTRFKVKYLEDINRKNFLRIRNAGLKTWCEFEEILKFLKYIKID